jgi:hypothetical protein
MVAAVWLDADGTFQPAKVGHSFPALIDAARLGAVDRPAQPE